MAKETQKKKDQPNDPKEFEIQGMLMAEVVRRILKKRGELELSGKPILECWKHHNIAAVCSTYV